MQFSTAAIATALLGLASAQKVHVVSVSSPSKSLTFSPDNIKAEAGDLIQFQFLAGNHSVVQSNFDNPCTPIQGHVANATGFFSGYMDVAASASSGQIPVYTVEVKDTKPLWVYCSQGKHCQAGMVMVVNENTAANSTRSLANFKNLAKAAPANLDPSSLTGGNGGNGDAANGGTSSSIPSPTDSVPSSSGSLPSPSTTPSDGPARALGSSVSVSAWTGLLSIAAAALAML
ncbi:Cupredoxin [Nemania sp. NC0429]|nr:Cupredoxin [Nemania sp. NC0429]